ncbi:MAG: hypothetical protein J6S04_02565 [Clostridia bacterium]|nr:hypothetical protein [Clostridia bacterium]
MKLEKREITLNEKDSLSDMLFMEKALLLEYVESLTKADRKETRERLLVFMKDTAEDLFFVKDLLEKVKSAEV